MDVFLNPLDKYVLTPYVYPEHWKEDDVERQFVSVFMFLNIGATLLYVFVAGFAYLFLFDQKLREHKFFLKDQERIEIGYALAAIPWMSLYTVPIFVCELQGYSKLYDNVEEYGLLYLVGSVFLFTMWNDFAVYWIHRTLHHALFYKRIHKVHHLFKVATPFAALAFTPLDGYVQSLPYHMFIFIFPMHKLTYLLSFVMIQMWTVFIHDHYYVIPETWDYYVNGSKHHTDHHMFFEYNYGLYFTLWDRIGGSHRNPSVNLKNGPMDHILQEEASKKE